MLDSFFVCFSLIWIYEIQHSESVSVVFDDTLGTQKTQILKSHFIILPTIPEINQSHNRPFIKQNLFVSLSYTHALTLSQRIISVYSRGWVDVCYKKKVPLCNCWVDSLLFVTKWCCMGMLHIWLASLMLSNMCCHSDKAFQGGPGFPRVFSTEHNSVAR